MNRPRLDGSLRAVVVALLLPSAALLSLLARGADAARRRWGR